MEIYENTFRNGNDSVTINIVKAYTGNIKGPAYVFSFEANNINTWREVDQYGTIFCRRIAKNKYLIRKREKLERLLVYALTSKFVDEYDEWDVEDYIRLIRNRGLDVAIEEALKEFDKVVAMVLLRDAQWVLDVLSQID